MNAFSEITSSANTVTPIIEEIKISMDEQNRGTQDINKTLSTLTNESHDIVAKVETGKKSMEELHKKIVDVGKITSKINSFMDEVAGDTNFIQNSSENVEQTAIGVESSTSKMIDIIKDLSFSAGAKRISELFKARRFFFSRTVNTNYGFQFSLMMEPTIFGIPLYWSSQKINCSQ